VRAQNDYFIRSFRSWLLDNEVGSFVSQGIEFFTRVRITHVGPLTFLDAPDGCLDRFRFLKLTRTNQTRQAIDMQSQVCFNRWPVRDHRRNF
jgi:hypothetical protein